MSSVSVIIPAFNAADVVSCAIESALRQTRPPLDVVVVDDGSTDGTANVVAAFPEPVRLVRQANSGPGGARNRAVKHARGEWLAFLDADDSWLPSKLERQLELTKDPQVGLVCCRTPIAGSSPHGPTVIGFETLWRRNPVILSTALVRRSAFEEVGGFDEDRVLDPVADYNLWLRLAARSWRLLVCHEDLYRYTPAPGCLSGQTERFARAELANIEKVARVLDLGPGQLKEKRRSVCLEYGCELLYLRKLLPARRLFREAWRIRTSLGTLGWLLMTFLPSPVLNWQRSRRKSLRRHLTQRC